MFKKHLFLVVALCVVIAMIVAGGVKLLMGGPAAPGGPGGPGGPQAAGGPGGGPGGRPGGPGGPGGFGGQRRGVPVTATTPVVRTFVDRIEVLGAAKAQQSITLTAPAQQLIQKVNFASGQFVRKGQVLAELQASEQEAGIAQAKSAADYAKTTWQRWQQLADRGIAPAATADQYRSQYEQAIANLNANRARLGDRVIRAPFSGTIGLTDAAPGMLVNPGSTIATLDDLSVIRVDFPVPERFMPVLKDGLAIDATADAYPATTFHGRIARVDTRIDPATRAVTARAEFPNPDGRLKPGMLLHVTINQAVRQSPAVPEEAVVFENGEAYVLLLQPMAPGAGGQGRGGRPGPGGQAQNGQAQNGPPQGGPAQDQPQGGPRGPGGPGGPGGRGGAFLAVRHVIGTGLRQEGFVQVTSGLEPGQRIVADGSNRVRPNDPVQVVGFSVQAAGGRGQGAGAPGQGGPGAAARQGADKPVATPQGVGPVASSDPAPAQAGVRQGRFARFETADTNKDGVVSQEEWIAAGRPAEAFARLDANGDGKLTRNEVQGFAAARRQGGSAQGGAVGLRE